MRSYNLCMEVSKNNTIEKPLSNSEKMMSKINVIFAYAFILMPITSLFFSLFIKNIDMLSIYVLIAIFYCMFLFTKFVMNFINKKRFQLTLTFSNIIIIMAFCWLTLNTIINKYSIADTIIAYGYFLLIYNFTTIDGRHTDTIISYFIFQMVISIIISLFDPFGKVFTIFGNNVPLSLQFAHFNYAGYILVLAIVLLIEKIIKEKDIKFLILWFASFFVMGTYILLQGTFVPITAMFLAIVVLIILEWIKNKKIPLRVLSCFIMLLPMIFLVDFWPNINEIRLGSSYNYFIEGIAVIDNFLGTDILPKLTGSFGEVVNSVPGSDGWDRKTLWANSIKSIFESAHNFILGQGAGHLYCERPHNLILGILIEYGCVGLILFALMLFSIFKAFVNINDKWSEYYKFTALMAMLLCYGFGAQVPYSFIFFIIFGTLFYNWFKYNKTEKTS